MWCILLTKETMSIEPVVRGIVDGLLSDGRAPVAVEETAAVLVRKIDAMPGLMRFGMRVLLVVFDWYGLFRGGARFRASGSTAQRARISEWANAPLGPCRDMVEFHRKMGTFVSMSLESE